MVQNFYKLIFILIFFSFLKINFFPYIYILTELIDNENLLNLLQDRIITNLGPILRFYWNGLPQNLSIVSNTSSLIGPSSSTRSGTCPASDTPKTKLIKRQEMELDRKHKMNDEIMDELKDLKKEKVKILKEREEKYEVQQQELINCLDEAE
jgi:hypothetical protein